MNDENETKILLQLNDHDNEIKSLKHRMETQEKESKAINSLAMSVEKLALNMNVMNEKQEEQGKRLAELESKPAKRWESIVEKAIITLVGAMVGFLLSRIGL